MLISADMPIMSIYIYLIISIATVDMSSIYPNMFFPFHLLLSFHAKNYSRFFRLYKFNTFIFRLLYVYYCVFLRL